MRDYGRSGGSGGLTFNPVEHQDKRRENRKTGANQEKTAVTDPANQVSEREITEEIAGIERVGKEAGGDSRLRGQQILKKDDGDVRQNRDRYCAQDLHRVDMPWRMNEG